MEPFNYDKMAEHQRQTYAIMLDDLMDKYFYGSGLDTREINTALKLAAILGLDQDVLLMVEAGADLPGVAASLRALHPAAYDYLTMFDTTRDSYAESRDSYIEELARRSVPTLTGAGTTSLLVVPHGVKVVDMVRVLAGDSEEEVGDDIYVRPGQRVYACTGPEPHLYDAEWYALYCMRSTAITELWVGSKTGRCASYVRSVAT